MSQSKLFTLSLALIASLLLFAVSAFALTPAGTTITNQASATYEDSGGTPHSTNSNEVYTTVNAVWGLTVTPNSTDAPGDGTFVAGQTQDAAPGVTVYHQYTLTNNANSADDFNVTPVNEITNDDFDPVGNSGHATNGIKIYHDVNGNGVVDPGELKLYDDSDATDLNLENIAADATTWLLIVFTTPSAGLTNGEVANVNLSVASVGGGNTDADNWNETVVSIDAILTSTKNVVPAGDVEAGATLSYTITGSNTGNQSTNDQIVISEVDGTDDDYYGVVIADPIPLKADGYPMTVSNIDGQPASGNVLYLVDNTAMLTIDLTTTVVNDWDAAATSDWQTSALATDIVWAVAYVTGGTTAGTGVIDPGQSYELTFDLTIPVDQAESDVVNRARVEFINNSGPARQNRLSNPVTNHVGGGSNATVGVVLFPPNSQSFAHDNTEEDRDRLATIAASQSATFTLSVYNAGNSSDLFNLSYASLPAGWTIEFYEMDGSTPINDDDGDAKPDIALLSKTTESFKVTLTVPGNQAAIGVATNVQIIATSDNDPTAATLPIQDLATTTVADSWVDNGNGTSNIQLAAVTGLVVGDIVNIDHQIRMVLGIAGTTITVDDIADPGAGVSVDVTAEITTQNDAYIGFDAVTPASLEYWNYDDTDTRLFANQTAGTIVNMPVYVSNTANASDTYTLSETLPASWSVTYYLDVNEDGILQAGEITAPVTSVTVAAADRGYLIARVNVPASATPTGGSGANGTPNAYAIDLIATSSNNSALSDVLDNEITIQTAYDLVLSPNRSGQGIPGNTVEYVHTLSNPNGNVNIPATTSYFTVSSDHGYEDQYTVYQDDGAGGWTLLNKNGSDQWELATAVGPAASTQIRVVFNVPTNAPEGTTEIGTITGIHGDNAGTTDFATETTTIFTSSLFLTKRVALDANNDGTETYASGTTTNSGSPNEALKYWVNFKNVSTEIISTVIINDAIPANTAFVVGSAGSENLVAGGNILIQYSNDGGVGWGYSPVGAAGDADPAVTNIRFLYANAGPVYIDLDSGEAGRVYFRVLIQ